MTLEVIAAILVGLAVLAVVLDPLLRNAAPPAQPLIEPEDLEETPKGIALAALREIEFDRATGKLSDEDYAALKAKYSEEALALIRAEENAQTSEAAPDRIEAMVEARLRRFAGRDPWPAPDAVLDPRQTRSSARTAATTWGEAAGVWPAARHSTPTAGSANPVERQ
jgi:hypothetical protein